MPFSVFDVPSSSIGVSRLRASFGSLLIRTAGLGIQACLCTQSLSSFLHSSKEERKSWRGYMQALIVILALSIYALIADGLVLMSIIELYPELLGGGAPRYSRPLWSRTSRLLALGAVQLIGDAVLVWRCYIIWTHRRWVVAFPLLAFFISLGKIPTYPVLKTQVNNCRKAWDVLVSSQRRLQLRE
ncbi:hypothetical protein FA15DRAFT_114919 [Coprinopsis marcescibilis]|uniref:Uncharacterized protein n=1 Tax=Coprinopsis marcescibilis TaxID=230819 RepID=A0A5C3KKG2_COPMA|nr:hypothetical protein FA15DRAFT_114919 [Coprinopsis marcescibilis]